MKTLHHPAHSLNSMGMLGLLVIVGAALTTWVQAGERGAQYGRLQRVGGIDASVGGYGSAAPLGLSAGRSEAPADLWLIPRGIRTSFDGTVYHIHFTGRERLGSVEAGNPGMAAGGLTLSVGLGEALIDDDDVSHQELQPTFLSDRDEERDRLTNPLFSMSLDQRW